MPSRCHFACRQSTSGVHHDENPTYRSLSHVSLLSGARQDDQPYAFASHVESDRPEDAFRHQSVVVVVQDQPDRCPQAMSAHTSSLIANPSVRCCVGDSL